MKSKDLFLVLLFICSLNNSNSFVPNITPMKTIAITNKCLSLRCSNDNNNSNYKLKINNEIEKIIKIDNIIFFIRVVNYTIVYVSVSSILTILKLMVINYYDNQ